MTKVRENKGRTPGKKSISSKVLGAMLLGVLLGVGAVAQTVEITRTSLTSLAAGSTLNIGASPNELGTVVRSASEDRTLTITVNDANATQDVIINVGKSGELFHLTDSINGSGQRIDSIVVKRSGTRNFPVTVNWNMRTVTGTAGDNVEGKSGVFVVGSLGHAGGVGTFAITDSVHVIGSGTSVVDGAVVIGGLSGGANATNEHTTIKVTGAIAANNLHGIRAGAANVDVSGRIRLGRSYDGTVAARDVSAITAAGNIKLSGSIWSDKGSGTATIVNKTHTGDGANIFELNGAIINVSGTTGDYSVVAATVDGQNIVLGGATSIIATGGNVKGVVAQGTGDITIGGTTNIQVSGGASAEPVAVEVADGTITVNGTSASGDKHGIYVSAGGAAAKGLHASSGKIVINDGVVDMAGTGGTAVVSAGNVTFTKGTIKVSNDGNSSGSGIELKNTGDEQKVDMTGGVIEVKGGGHGIFVNATSSTKPQVNVSGTSAIFVMEGRGIYVDVGTPGTKANWLDDGKNTVFVDLTSNSSNWKPAFPMMLGTCTGCIVANGDGGMGVALVDGSAGGRITVTNTSRIIARGVGGRGISTGTTKVGGAVPSMDSVVVSGTATIQADSTNGVAILVHGGSANNNPGRALIIQSGTVSAIGKDGVAFIAGSAFGSGVGLIEIGLRNAGTGPTITTWDSVIVDDKRSLEMFGGSITAVSRTGDLASRRAALSGIGSIAIRGGTVKGENGPGIDGFGERYIGGRNLVETPSANIVITGTNASGIVTKGGALTVFEVINGGGSGDVTRSITIQGVAGTTPAPGALDSLYGIRAVATTASGVRTLKILSRDLVGNSILVVGRDGSVFGNAGPAQRHLAPPSNAYVSLSTEGDAIGDNSSYSGRGITFESTAAGTAAATTAGGKFVINVNGGIRLVGNKDGNKNESTIVKHGAGATDFLISAGKGSLSMNNVTVTADSPWGLVELRDGGVDDSISIRQGTFSQAARGTAVFNRNTSYTAGRNAIELVGVTVQSGATTGAVVRAVKGSVRVAALGNDSASVIATATGTTAGHVVSGIFVEGAGNVVVQSSGTTAGSGARASVHMRGGFGDAIRTTNGKIEILGSPGNTAVIRTTGGRAAFAGSDGVDGRDILILNGDIEATAFNRGITGTLDSALVQTTPTNVGGNKGGNVYIGRIINTSGVADQNTRIVISSATNASNMGTLVLADSVYVRGGTLTGKRNGIVARGDILIGRTVAPATGGLITDDVESLAEHNGRFSYKNSDGVDVAGSTITAYGTPQSPILITADLNALEARGNLIIDAQYARIRAGSSTAPFNSQAVVARKIGMEGNGAGRVNIRQVDSLRTVNTNAGAVALLIGAVKDNDDAGIPHQISTGNIISTGVGVHTRDTLIVGVAGGHAHIQTTTSTTPAVSGNQAGIHFSGNIPAAIWADGGYVNVTGNADVTAAGAGTGIRVNNGGRVSVSGSDGSWITSNQGTAIFATGAGMEDKPLVNIEGGLVQNTATTGGTAANLPSAILVVTDRSGLGGGQEGVHSTDVVTVSGGKVRTVMGNHGRAINVIGNGNVNITGGTVEAIATGSGANFPIAINMEGATVENMGNVAISATGTRIDQLIKLSDGTTNAPLVPVVNIVTNGGQGIGIRTTGGTVSVSTNDQNGSSVSFDVGAGTGIRADSTTLRKSGVVTVGTAVAAAPTNSEGVTSFTGTTGTLISAVHEVLVLNRVNMHTAGGTAISADTVVIGVDNTPNSENLRPVIQAGGQADGNNAVGVSAQAIYFKRGYIRAGSASNSSAIATGIRVPASNKTLNRTVVLDTAAIIRAFNNGTGIKVENPRVKVVMAATGAATEPCSIWVGDNGTGITTVGSAELRQGIVLAGDGANSRAVELTGAGGTLTIGLEGGTAEQQPKLYAGNNADGTVRISNASAAMSLVNGYLQVNEGGTVVKTSGGFVSSGSNSYIVAAGEKGIGLNASGEVLFLGGNLRSKDVGISSTQPVIIGRGLTINSAPTEGGTGTGGIYLANLSGALDANVTVRSDGELNVYNGGKLIVNSGKTVTVSAGGYLKTGADGTVYTDTLIVLGTVNAGVVTQLSQPYFVNEGTMILGETGDFRFNQASNVGTSLTARNLTFRNVGPGGKMILSQGSSFNGKAITDFMYWADSVTAPGTFGSTGAKAIIPPVWADTASAWGMKAATAIDTVYNVSDVKVMLNERFLANYAGDPAAGEVLRYRHTSGDLPEGMASTVGAPILLDTLDGGIRGLLTKVGNYEFEATAENIAGKSSKTHVFRVVRATPTEEHLTAFVMNGNIKENMNQSGEVRVKYSGERNPVTVTGDTIVVENVKYFAEFTGFGLRTPWYTGDVDQNTYYPRTNIAPTDAGTYFVTAVIDSGLNFNAARGANAIEIGTLVIEPADVADLIDPVVLFTLPAGREISKVSVPMPDITKYFARYVSGSEEPGIPLPILNPGSSSNLATLEDVYVDNSVDLEGDSTLVFGVTGASELGNQLIFTVPVVPGAMNNVNMGEVRVVVQFTDERGLREAPAVLAIDYERELVSQFQTKFGYTVNGTALARGTTDIPIQNTWFGDTIIVVTLASTEYRINSNPLSFYVDARPAAPEVDFRGANEGVANGAILGTTTAMEYRRVGANTWITASAGIQDGLLAGDYEVRFAAVPGRAFASEIALVGIPTGIAEQDRDIKTDNEEVSVVTPIRPTATQFTAGPNPAAKSTGKIAFFWQGQSVANGTLSVYDAAGNLVRKVSVTDNGTTTARREIGSWNMTDSKGRAVADGTYLVRGTLKGRDGSTIRVSYMVGVR